MANEEVLDKITEEKTQKNKSDSNKKTEEIESSSEIEGEFEVEEDLLEPIKEFSKFILSNISPVLDSNIPIENLEKELGNFQTQNEIKTNIYELNNYTSLSYQSQNNSNSYNNNLNLFQSPYPKIFSQNISMGFEDSNKIKNKLDNSDSHAGYPGIIRESSNSGLDNKLKRDRRRY